MISQPNSKIESQIHQLLIGLKLAAQEKLEAKEPFLKIMNMFLIIELLLMMIEKETKADRNGNFGNGNGKTPLTSRKIIGQTG